LNETDAIELLQSAIWAACLIAGPMVLPAMIGGIVIAMLQAVTQVQESTLTFVPKMGIVIVAGFAASSLIGSQLMLLTEKSFEWIVTGF
jgi:flagellar biosynthetic protein FliQ